VVRAVAVGAERKEVESESIMVGGLLPSRAAVTVSLPFVAAEHVEPMRGAGVKVTDKGRGRREGGGQGTDSHSGLNGCCNFWRRRGNVEVAAIVLRGRDTRKRRGGDEKEKPMPSF
jgi:hypothetical protein